jgi:hypothetical protein
MNKGKLIAGVALVFIVGILVGSLGTQFYFRHHYHPFERDRAKRTAFIMKRLSNDLQLTDAQQVAIQRIVEQTQEKIHEHFLQRRSEIEGIMNDGFLQMKKELNDDQKKKLDGLRERFEKRRQAREGAFPKPPPPPPKD